MSRGKLRVLVDTSFILPFLGFRTRDDVMGSLEALRPHEVYYSDLSVLEALWKAVKLLRNPDDVKVMAQGIRLLSQTLRRIEIDEGAVGVAVEMYLMGHRDLIDDLLYGIAVSRSLLFLTVDSELRRFVKASGIADVTIGPDGLAGLTSS